MQGSALVMVFGFGVVLALMLLLLLRRRAELRAMDEGMVELRDAVDRGSHKARLLHPDIDLSECIGCGLCVKACPEEGVLAMLHGQAVVVHGARCVGHARCAAVCPTAGIAVTIGDLSSRRDLPAINESLEVAGMPGMYIAGELSGYALVRTAVAHGTAVADAVVRGRDGEASAEVLIEGEPASGGVLELLVVGAGPAGIACSLRAKELGLDFRTIEQGDRIGGTVASYPRRKLVMTQPMHLPLHGKLPRLDYQKEELEDLWNELYSKHRLPIDLGVRVTGIARRGDGVYEVKTTGGDYYARHVCLALGRRGTPRKLGVEGEDLPKVAYSLLDAESYKGRRILVVGGGDSAIEAAVGLSEQPGNEVTISYRKHAFFRIKARNQTRIDKAIQSERVRVLYESDIERIDKGSVTIRIGKGDAAETEVIENDEVFVFAGGIPPFKLLEDAGVSFDPEDRPVPTEIIEKASAVIIAMGGLLVVSVGIFFWAFLNHEYYTTPASLRPGDSVHSSLRPASMFGAAFGVLACTMFAWNLLYLIKRTTKLGRWIPGSLRLWLGTHVFSGVASILFVLVHAGFSMRHSVGGHALGALIIVIVAGGLGRYLYAFMPHAANGAELSLEEIRIRMRALTGDWDRLDRGFGSTARKEIESLIQTVRWRAGLHVRIGRLIASQVRLRRALKRIRISGQAEDIPPREVRRVILLARKAFRMNLLVQHYEEIRSVLSSWRYIHRWLALMMVSLAVVHIITALRYATLPWDTISVSGGGMP